MTNRIKQIQALGQAIWIDFISRELLQSGQLTQMMADGVTGMTSNPTIFQKSIATGKDYDADIQRLWRQTGERPADVFEAIAVSDVGAAADALLPVFRETSGRDGFVSIEVSPRLAHDTDGTIAEARRLYSKLARPNVMIKVPATNAGLPAIATLIGEGTNVNVTLIFSIEMYEKVMGAYLEGLRRLHAAGKPLNAVSSVASFFISRVDSLVDKLLAEKSASGVAQAAALAGRAAVANAKIAYSRYKAVFGGGDFTALRAAGARVQRPLWASTSTKNPAYSPTLYVDNLIGPNTVNTLPPQTLEELRKPGAVAQTIEQGLDDAHSVIRQLEGLGIHMNEVTDQLLVEGVKLFADSFDQLLADVERKCNAMARV